MTTTQDPEVNSRLAELAAQANIALTMIVRDEERTLADCLASAKGVFMQTVVVDTGSKDRTKEIAQSFGVDVYDLHWHDSFAEARNVALSKAKCPWVFWLDADDTLPANTAEAVLHAAINAPDDVVGFVVPVQFVGEDTTRVDHVKLFRNIEGLQWEYRVHEQILPALQGHGRIERIDAPVLHSGYDTSQRGQARKRARNEKLLKLDLKDHPENAFILFNLGVETQAIGRNRDAVRWLEESIRRSRPNDNHTRKAFGLLAGAHQALGNYQAAANACELGLQIIGPDPELRFRAGQAYASMGQLEKAKQHYLLVPEQPQEHFAGIDTAILGAKREHNLGLVCVQLGEQFEAKEWFRKAIDAGFPESAVALTEYSIEQNDALTAASALESLRKMEGVTTLWTVLSARLALIKGQDEISFLEETVAHNPDATAPALVLAKKLLEAGRDQDAEPYLKFLEKKGHADAPYLRGAIAGRRGEFVAAIAHTQRALEMEPNHQGAKNQMDVLLRAMGR